MKVRSWLLSPLLMFERSRMSWYTVGEGKRMNMCACFHRKHGLNGSHEVGAPHGVIKVLVEMEK